MGQRINGLPEFLEKGRFLGWYEVWGLDLGLLLQALERENLCGHWREEGGRKRNGGRW